MKKFVFTVLAAAASFAAMAQTDIWCWQDGVATKKAATDSVTFAKPASLGDILVWRKAGKFAKYTELTDVDSITFVAPVTHEYVDLGLSVKWATCNVGAEKPEDYGDYFAWGDTKKTTSIYGDAWDYYGFCEYVGESENIWDDDGYDVIGNGSAYVFSKYNRTDGKTVLDAEDDAAAVNWGGAWRMPTVDELEELYENCTWEYKEDFNGVSGYKVTSKKTGYTDKYIFLPLAGFIDSFCEDAYKDGVEVMLWSSSLVPEAYKLREAYNLRGKKDGSYEVENSFRSTACSVRPVCP